MKDKICIISYLIIAFSCFIPKIYFAQTEKAYYDNIVIFKTKTIKSECKKLENYLNNLKEISISNEFSINKTRKKYESIANIYRIEFFQETDIFKIIQELNTLSEIEYAEPLYKTYLLFSANDQYAENDQYWIKSISADKAWDICKGDTNIVIGISDTGIDFSHEDLIGQIKYNYLDPIDGIDNDDDGYCDNFYGWDFGDNDNNPQCEKNQHGVIVTGIAAAETNNEIGVAGAAFNCRFLPIKISNANGDLVNVYQSILYAAEHGCSIVNCSWGSEYYQEMAQDIINYVSENYDLLVVAAAGNTGSETEFYPASYQNVLSVTGCFDKDEIWTASRPDGNASSYSYSVDITAPCGKFIATYNDNKYGTAHCGTSFAAPIVAGAAAILRSYFPSYNARQIEELIRISSDNIDTISENLAFAEKIGSGKINLYKALTMQQTASIRFHNYNTIYDKNKIIINGCFTNYLANAENATITANLISDNAKLNSNVIFTGKLSTLENYETNNQIIIDVFETAKNGEIGILELVYNATNYSAKQKIYLKIKKEYIEIENDIMSLSIPGNGRLAFNDINGKNGNGLRFNKKANILSECSIIAGNSKNNIYSASQKISDFNNIVYPIEKKDNKYFLFDQNIYSEFDDSNDSIPLNIKYTQNVFAKNGEKYKNFYLLDYQLVNNNNYNINDFYFGIFCDWDIIEASSNSSFFNKENNFMYCAFENQENIYAGIKLLSKQKANNYSFPLYENEDNEIDINDEDGFSDYEKFILISTPFSNNNTINKDIAISTSAGPFTIPANDSVNLSFAILASDNYNDLINSANFAQNLYNTLNHKNENKKKNYNDICIMPSIADNFIDVFFNNDENIDANLEILNLEGQCIFSDKFFKYQNINTTDLKSGVYIIKIKYDNNNFYTKFIKK